MLRLRYSYDNNDNRILDSDTVFDAQDRLTRNRDWTFTYNARGYLSTKTSRTTTSVVNYVYDNLGQLRTVTDNAGLNLSYIYDAQGRQIGKVKNGALSRGLIYRDQLRPAAELNSNGSLKSVFVYGSRGHVPEFMDRAGVSYRFVTDHLGSVRMVVNLSTKQVVQAISYDGWGKVLSDSNPGFQPFGYAGGIYDHETGLVRFGARDYDGRIGRWLDKDPIRFDGGMNFYVYAGNDPINFVDINGLEEKEIVVLDGSFGSFGSVYRHGRNNRMLILGGSSPNETIEKIKARLSDGDTIKKLIFNGHGSDKDVPIGKNSTSIWTADTENYSSLRKHFAPSATVEFESCNAGQNPSLLRYLSKQLGVPVHANTGLIFSPTGTGSGTDVRCTSDGCK